MPITTSTSTTTTGGSTTVGATVRDEGPGGLPRTVDVFLHIEPAKATQVSYPTPAYYSLDINRLSVWWKDLTLAAGGSLAINYKIKRKPGAPCEGAIEGLLVVCDSGTKKTFEVKRFCICPEATAPRKAHGLARPSARKQVVKRPARKATKKSTRRTR